jgi:hypothetical protein
MPNTTSASLKLTVQATGENSGTWGQITNTNLLILEQAIGGYAGVALNATTGATLTFSNGALSDGKNQVLKLTGTITTNVDVIVPDSVEKTYVVENATSGAFTVTVKTTSGSGVTWGTTDKGKKLIYSDGTNILEGISSIDTLKVSTFTSTGIDDNATSTAITINSSEQVEFTAGTALLPAITTTGDTNTGMWFPAADTIAFSEGGVEAMRITSTGNVGIGTSSPGTDFSKVLHISGASAATATTGGSRLFYTGTSGSGNWSVYDGTAAAYRAIIDSSGRVMIGTTTEGQETADNLTIADTGHCGITLRSGASSVGSIFFSDATSGADEYVGYVQYNHTDNYMKWQTNGAERMRIDSSGNVGIGTTAPDAKLSVNGVASFGDGTALLPSIANFGDLNTGMWFPAADTIAFSEGGTEVMRINSSGNVGIGTTSPTQKLSVTGSITCSGGLSATGNITSTGATNAFGNMQVNGSGGAGGVGFKYVFSAVNKITMNNLGNMSVSGALSKGSGSFKIDHPLPSKSNTHNLVHSFIEAPQADNIYRGKVDLVNGTATVNIDTVAGMSEGTFILLNREIQCFTSNETGWTAVKGSVSGNTLTITAQDETCTDTISWLVIGERQDQHMYDTNWTDDNGKVIVEPLKETEE